jgi:hypothetical protein
MTPEQFRLSVIEALEEIHDDRELSEEQRDVMWRAITNVRAMEFPEPESVKPPIMRVFKMTCQGCDCDHGGKIDASICWHSFWRRACKKYIAVNIKRGNDD